MAWLAGEMNSLRQIFAISLVNVRSIPLRFGPSLVICVGIAGVVAVLIAVLAMAAGLQGTLAAAGRPDRTIVIRNGALAEALSSLSRAAIVAIEAAPGVGRLENGGPAVSPEVMVSVNLPRKDRSQLSAIAVRGVTDAAFELRPEFLIVGGRTFRPGLREVVVGAAAASEFSAMDVGGTVSFHGGEWTIVGTFESAGDVHESELLVDANTLMSAAQRTVFNAATVRLESPASFDVFTAALLRDPLLKVEVKRETDYYVSQSQGVADLLDLVANVIGAIMALGALFGALNTMYAAVAVRTVEIATLRAIGFGAVPVVVSVLVEAVALALVGAGAGALIAWLLFSGNAFSTGNALAQVAMKLHIGADLVAVGVVWAIAIGVVGGVLPAIRAARLSVAASLRAR